MPTEPLMRLRTSQHAEIRDVRQIRAVATGLRERASGGSYTENDLAQFWSMTVSAGIILGVSNPQLGIRAGLGEGFFNSIARDRRRPKLQNYFKALYAIVEVSDELLGDIDNEDSEKNDAKILTEKNTILYNADDLRMLAFGLALIARREIRRIDEERPNDPDVIDSNKRTRGLLLIFAGGFEKIAAALARAQEVPAKDLHWQNAQKVISSVGAQVSTWWRNNGSEMVDLTARIPIFAAGVGMLNLGGANMTIATSAMAALVGGERLAKAVRRK